MQPHGHGVVPTGMRVGQYQHPACEPLQRDAISRKMLPWIQKEPTDIQAVACTPDPFNMAASLSETELPGEGGVKLGTLGLAVSDIRVHGLKQVGLHYLLPWTRHSRIFTRQGKLKAYESPRLSDKNRFLSCTE